MTMTPPHTSFARPPVKANVAAKLASVRANLAPRSELATLILVLGLIALWGAAIATFGYPALIIPALIAVPSIFAVLILITWG